MKESQYFESSNKETYIKNADLEDVLVTRDHVKLVCTR